MIMIKIKIKIKIILLTHHKARGHTRKLFNVRLFMPNTTFLPYAQQHISSEDINAVTKALTQPIITRGQLVDAFENRIADYCGAKYGVAFNSGSTALLAAYFAADLGHADRIVTTSNSFIASIGSGVQFSATPVFLDIDRDTGNLDLNQLQHNINQPSLRSKTVIVPVHFAGIPVDMEAVDGIISDSRTIIIEDAAHAIGSRYKDGQRVGCCAWSHMTVFSFHPAKTITTGEGGMVTTNDPELYHRLQLFRNNGIVREPELLKRNPGPWHYEVVALTSNYNFTEFQAALGLSQLERIDDFVSKRQALMRLYKQKLAAFEHIRLMAPENLFIAPHLCVVQIDFEAYKTNRSDVMFGLKDRGIGTQLHYIPLYRHPVFADKMGDVSEYFPQMEAYYEQALSLPLYFDLSEEDVETVVKNLKEVLRC